MHRCTNFGRRSPWRELCTEATNICGSSVCNLLRNTIPAPRILRLLLDFFQNLYIPLLLINPLNAELNPICHLLALLGAHYIFHVSGLRVNINGMKPDIYIILKHSVPIAQKTRCLHYTER